MITGSFNRGPFFYREYGEAESYSPYRTIYVSRPITKKRQPVRPIPDAVALPSEHAPLWFGTMQKKKDKYATQTNVPIKPAISMMLFAVKKCAKPVSEFADIIADNHAGIEHDSSLSILTAKRFSGTLTTAHLMQCTDLKITPKPSAF